MPQNHFVQEAFFDPYYGNFLVSFMKNHFMFRYLSFTNTPVTHFLLYENTFHSKSFISPTLQQLIFHSVKKIISLENICFCNTVTHFLFFENSFLSNILSSSISWQLNFHFMTKAFCSKNFVSTIIW